MRKIRVLLTDASHKNALAVLRHLGPSNKYEFHVTSVFPRYLSLCFYSKYAKKKIRLKCNRENIDEYAEELLKVVKLNNYDVLLPVGQYTYLTVSKYKQEFEAYVNLVVPEWEKMKIASRKHVTFEFAKRIGIPTPKSFVVEDENGLERNDFKFPVVLKSSDFPGGRSVVYCNNRRQLFIKFDKLRRKSKTKILLQEFIPGTGHGFYALYRNGKMLAYFMHKRVKEYPKTGGPSVVAESFYDKKLFKYGKKIIDKLKWNGPIMAEFRLDERDNEYKLLELNPKLWGSLDLTIEAGVNIPEMIIRIALNESVEMNKTYQYVRYKWLIPDELKYTLAYFSFKNVIDFLDVRGSKTNLYFHDPIPFIPQIMKGLIEGISAIFSRNVRYPQGIIC